MKILDTIRFNILRKKVKKAQVKGLISKNEAKFLFNCSLNSSVHSVEIGSFQGYSTIFLAHAIKLRNHHKLTAIDPHLGLLIDGINIDTYDNFIRNIKHFDLLPYIDLKKVTSEKAVQYWNEPISFLWIDGNHDYEAVKLDYTLWQPFLIKSGIIAFHDAGQNGNCWPGPRKLVDEIELNGKFTPFQYVEGIAWARKV